jgi:hypothetical protein
VNQTGVFLTPEELAGVRARIAAESFKDGPFRSKLDPILLAINAAAEERGLPALEPGNFYGLSEDGEFVYG